MTADATDAPTSDQGNFFAVEGAMWAKVCARDSINEAIAYLVLARGSNMGTRKSSWSVEAIETRTDISRIRAKEALHSLVQSGLVQQHRAGTRPQYYLPTAHECENPAQPPIVLTPIERMVLDMIDVAGEPIAVPVRGTDKNGWPKHPVQAIADKLVGKGMLTQPHYGKYVIAPKPAEVEPPKPEWTWLPNSIVDGVDGVTAPVEQIRQTQSLPALRLFVDLYFAQSLAFNGGVHWRQIRKKFDKVLVGRSGIYDVWGFREGTEQTWSEVPFVAAHLTGRMEPIEGTDIQRDTGMPVFWGALAKLEQLGLAQFVGHVIDADTEEGEVVHPFGFGAGEPIERRLATAAYLAGSRLLNEDKVEAAREQAIILIPLARHRSNSELVGLLRLTHRAHTTATADWLAKSERWLKWTETYEQIGRATSADELARSKGDQGEVKGGSMGSQRGVKGG